MKYTHAQCIGPSRRRLWGSILMKSTMLLSVHQPFCRFTQHKVYYRSKTLYFLTSTILRHNMAVNHVALSVQPENLVRHVGITDCWNLRSAD
jgi:hypothetical protein